MIVRRRHTRVAIEQKTVRLAGVFTPGDATAGEACAQVREMATIESGANPLELSERQIGNGLRSLYLALRRVVAGRAESRPNDSVTSGITLVAKPTVPVTKEPRS